jgi:hypothetical protein
MSLKLPDPPAKYDQARQRRLQHDLELADMHNRKETLDIEVYPARLILRSPNGTRYSVTVSNAGVLAAVVIP